VLAHALALFVKAFVRQAKKGLSSAVRVRGTTGILLSGAIIVHEKQTNAFTIVVLKSVEAVAGESVAAARLSLERG